MIETLLLALTAHAPLQHPPVNPRDRDPWVFRSVLDQRARIVTLALNHEMWIAYDAQTCGLYKCWKGGVDFKGAVYTSVHGDQPIARGETYSTGVEGVVWGAERDGKALDVRTVWRGYFFKEGRAHLQYEVVLPDGIRIAIQETPDCFTSEQLLPAELLEEFALVHGLPTLYRSFVVDAIPDGVVLFARVKSDGEHLLRRELFPPGVLRSEKAVEDARALAAGRQTYAGELVFAKESLMANLVSFYEPLPDPEPPRDARKDGGDARKERR
ncbi:MAG: hypothetical protein HZA53_00460 [Planctomycetes bacterium]|nr:hypothetical protein [Planctomycetota bacterium]